MASAIQLAIAPWPFAAAQVGSAPPIVYVLVFFGLLIAAALAFAFVARKSFAEAEQRELEDRRRVEPREKREAAHRARGQRRQRMWLAVRESGLKELASKEIGEPLRALQRLHDMLGHAQEWEQKVPGGDALEITELADRLYDLALGQVERAINLRDLANAVPGDAGPAPLRPRLDDLLADLNSTIGTLAAALDQLHACAVAGGFDPAARQRLRDDLDSRLRIVARVDRRVRELE